MSVWTYIPVADVRGRVRHREAPGVGPHGGGQPGPGEPQLIGGDIEPDGAVARLAQEPAGTPGAAGHVEAYRSAAGTEAFPEPGLLVPGWKAEKVSSYHSEWPSYRAVPGLTRIRLARRSATAKARVGSGGRALGIVTDPGKPMTRREGTSFGVMVLLAGDLAPVGDEGWWRAAGPCPKSLRMLPVIRWTMADSQTPPG